jgi:hypothetical protein
VVVAVRQEDGPVANDLVDHLPRRDAVREDVDGPSTAQDPRSVRMRLGIPAHQVEIRVELVRPAEVAPDPLEAARRCVDVRVLETGQQHATLERNLLGVRADELAHLVVRAD